MKNIITTIGAWLVVVVGVIGIVGLAFGLPIIFWALIALLVCNVILPLFEVNYVITWLQACGIGVIILLLRLFTSRVVISK